MTPLTRSRRAWTIALFAAYLVLLTWLVLWKLQAPYVGRVMGAHVSVVPFANTFLPRELLANVAIFVPFGVYLGLLAPTWRWWTTGAVAAAGSLALEAGQLVLGVGIPDATDLVANTAGGLLGVGLLALVRRTLGAKADVLTTWVCAAGTGIAVVAVAAFLASPAHYVPPQDVGPLSVQQP